MICLNANVGALEDDCVYEANILVSATGTLNVPTYPNIPGKQRGNHPLIMDR